MTPADELRTAAERLRKLAGQASEAPWSTGWNGQEYELRSPDEAAYPIAEWTYAIATTGPKVDAQRSECDTADADWIATMHPAVGLALATLLEGVLSSAREASPAHEECTDWCSPETCDLSAALAVARAINGSPS